MIPALNNRASRPMSIFDYLNNPALQSEAYKNGTQDAGGNPIFTDGKGTKHYGYKSKQAFDASERAVGGKTIVGVTYGPGQKYSSVAGWNYNGFGDGNQSEANSSRDEFGVRVGTDQRGNQVDVGDRINAQVGLRFDNQPGVPTQGNRGGMGGGLDWLRDRSPLAVMGRQMTPAQQMLGDPNDPYSQAAVLQRDKKYGSLFPDDDPDPFEN